MEGTEGYQYTAEEQQKLAEDIERMEDEGGIPSDRPNLMG